VSGWVSYWRGGSFNGGVGWVGGSLNGGVGLLMEGWGGSLNGGRTWLHRRSPGQLSRYSDSLRTLRFAVRKPAGERFSAPVRPDRLWSPPSLLYNLYRVFPALGRGVDHPPIRSAEFKERV
jgi:hypothetical protein